MHHPYIAKQHGNSFSNISSLEVPKLMLAFCSMCGFWWSQWQICDVFLSQHPVLKNSVCPVYFVHNVMVYFSRRNAKKLTPYKWSIFSYVEHHKSVTNFIIIIILFCSRPQISCRCRRSTFHRPEHAMTILHISETQAYNSKNSDPFDCKSR